MSSVYHLQWQLERQKPGSRCAKFVLRASKTTLWIGRVTGFRKFDLYIPEILPGKSPVKQDGSIRVNEKQKGFTENLQKF